MELHHIGYKNVLWLLNYIRTNVILLILSPKFIINEFDTAVQECTDISEEDYAILLTAVSEQSTSKLENLMEIKKADPERFMSNVHSIIAAEKSQREKQKTHYKEERLRSQEELRKMQQSLNEAMARFKKTEERILVLESDNSTIKKENTSLKHENDYLKLRDWKRPRYIACTCLIILCILMFILYFAWQDWEYNYPAKLMNYICGLEETKKDLAKNVLFISHSVIFISSVYAILCLRIIQDNQDKRFWFTRLVKNMLSKE